MEYCNRMALIVKRLLERFMKKKKKKKNAKDK